MNNLEEFMCKLAIELHLPLVEVLNLPASEIHRWQEYFSKNLFTADRVEYQLAQIAFIIYNANSSKKLDFDDFIPKRKPIRDSEEMIVSKLEMLRVLFGRKE